MSGFLYLVLSGDNVAMRSTDFVTAVTYATHINGTLFKAKQIAEMLPTKLPATLPKRPPLANKPLPVGKKAGKKRVAA